MKAWGAPPSVIDVVSWERLQRIQDREDRLCEKDRYLVAVLMNSLRKGRYITSKDYTLVRLEKETGLRK